MSNIGRNRYSNQLFDMTCIIILSTSLYIFFYLLELSKKLLLFCSGPSRFDWDQDTKAWIYRRKKVNLYKLLEAELEQLCGKPFVLSWGIEVPPTHAFWLRRQIIYDERFAFRNYFLFHPLATFYLYQFMYQLLSYLLQT